MASERPENFWQIVDRGRCGGGRFPARPRPLPGGSRYGFMLLLLARVLIATSNMFAAQPKVLGLDDMSCAWTVKTDPELRQSYVDWVRGFLSGHNYANQCERCDSAR
jgi:hypothetical protein